jgi:4-hydroxy-tetrahydrodipicolinate synthase
MSGNHGLLVTPFDATQELDLNSYGNLIEFAIEGGVDGLIPLGTTGEFFSLTLEEKRKVIDFTVSQVRDRVPIWIGVGYSGTRIAAELAEYSADRGVYGVLVPPPYYYPLSDNAMHVHFSAIAKAANVEVMLYDGAGGTEIPLKLIQLLNEENPLIRNVKVSVLRSSKVAALHSALGHKIKLFCGDETMLMPALANGAVGMATASGVVLPRICSDICSSYLAGRRENARDLYARYLAPWTIVSGITKSEFVRCFKEALAASGIIASPMTRLPLGELDPGRKDELLAVARQVGILLRVDRALPIRSLV